MHIVVTEESHNRAVWQVKRPLLQILVGLLLATLFLAALVAFSPSALRWRVTGAIVGLGLTIGTVLVLTVPSVDCGLLDRRPDGGDLRRTKTWFIRGIRETLSLDLEDVEAFDLETRHFEEGPTEIYALSRLWVVDRAGNRAALTDWAEGSSVQTLGDVLAKVGRRGLGPCEDQGEGAAVV